jgi:hypothetical protein
MHLLHPPLTAWTPLCRLSNELLTRHRSSLHLSIQPILVLRTRQAPMPLHPTFRTVTFLARQALELHSTGHVYLSQSATLSNAPCEVCDAFVGSFDGEGVVAAGYGYRGEGMDVGGLEDGGTNGAAYFVPELGGELRVDPYADATAVYGRVVRALICWGLGREVIDATSDGAYYTVSCSRVVRGFS